MQFILCLVSGILLRWWRRLVMWPFWVSTDFWHGWLGSTCLLYRIGKGERGNNGTSPFAWRVRLTFICPVWWLVSALATILDRAIRKFIYSVYCLLQGEFEYSLFSPLLLYVSGSMLFYVDAASQFAFKWVGVIYLFCMFREPFRSCLWSSIRMRVTLLDYIICWALHLFDFWMIVASVEVTEILDLADYMRVLFDHLFWIF